MSRPTVVLHIGAMKTGTSYIQSVLGANRDLLARRGVLWAGEQWKDQRKAVEALLAADRRKLPPPAAWETLARQMTSYQGDVSLMSMEFLSFAPASAAAQAMKALSGCRVRVVLTARDLGRAVPAQWQESMQNLHAWSYRDYVDGLMGYPEVDSRGGRHFWVRQDWPSILRNWRTHVAPDDLVLATLPASGAPTTTLWERFCQAAGIDADGFDLDGFENDSLGATSAELMHLVSAEALQRGFKPADFTVFKRVLAKRVLAKRRKDEPAIVFPPAHREWLEARSAELIDQIRQIGPRVVGDLDDLRPRWGERPGMRSASDMETVTDRELLDAALEGLFGLAAAIDRRGPGQGQRR